MNPVRRFTPDSDEVSSAGHEQANRPTLVIDAEVLIRKTFDQSPDEGMALLFQRYYQSLCSHAVRFVSSKEIAEDLVSDLFYDFQSKELYQTITTSYRAFLFTAIRNRSFDYVQREMKWSTSLEGAESLPEQDARQPDTVTQYEELYHDVEKAINSLSLKRRQVYVMHRFDGKKYDEIARELHISPRTVENHMATAIHHVRQILRKKWLFLVLGCLHWL